jgi:hypothetical protein
LSKFGAHFVAVLQNAAARDKTRRSVAVLTKQAREPIEIGRAAREPSGSFEPWRAT